MLAQDPCLLGQLQGALEPSSRWGLTYRSCEGLEERGPPLGAVLSMTKAGSLTGEAEW